MLNHFLLLNLLLPPKEHRDNLATELSLSYIPTYHPPHCFITSDLYIQK